MGRVEGCGEGGVEGGERVRRQMSWKVSKMVARRGIVAWKKGQIDKKEIAAGKGNFHHWQFATVVLHVDPLLEIVHFNRFKNPVTSVWVAGIEYPVSWLQ